MKKPQKKIPALRFPEFEGDWETRKLNTFLTQSKAKNKSLEFEKSQVLSVAAEVGIVNQIEYHGRSYAGVSVAPYGIVRKGEIVYTKSPLKAYPYGIIKLNEYADGIVSTLYAIYKVSKNASGKFLDYYFYHEHRINRYLKPLVNIGAKNDMKVNNDYVVSAPITAPSLTEQQKIAAFLTAIDTRIGHLERKKTLLEQYKKGVMQRIFSQELRFKDDNGKDFPSWEEKKLGELLSYEQPTKYIVKSTEYQDQYPIPVLTAGKSFILGFTNEKNGVFSATKKDPIILFDDFTTAFQFVDFPFKVKSSAIKILKPKNHSILIKFILEAMGSIKIKLGEDHKRYWISEYSKLRIPYPSLPEQQKIAAFLTAIDDKITLVADQIEKTKTYKKGLLQQMFV